ncbi:BQ2448_4839 [Microbotryum intermedium]|uniref:BQ2448_4839 protein n=1 Tax=Microbotryum intermedium TaxID=269621 RepID=A0A238FG22_9BASI|nr:BQ2448_4839 [Microbotryum intermedium]
MAETASSSSSITSTSRTSMFKSRVTKAAQAVRKLSQQPVVTSVPEETRSKPHDTPPSYTTSPESPAGVAFRKARSALAGVTSTVTPKSPRANGPSPRPHDEAGSTQSSFRSAKRNSAAFRQTIAGEGIPPPPPMPEPPLNVLSIQGLEDYAPAHSPDGYVPVVRESRCKEVYLPKTSMGPLFTVPALDGLGLIDFGEEDLVMSDTAEKGHTSRTARLSSASLPTQQGHIHPNDSATVESKTSSNVAVVARPRLRPNRTSSSSVHTLEIKLASASFGLPAADAASMAAPQQVANSAPPRKTSAPDLQSKVAEYRRRESNPINPTSRVGAIGPVLAAERRKTVAGDSRLSRSSANRAALRESLYKPLPSKPTMQALSSSRTPSGYCIRPSVSTATQTPSWWPSSTHAPSVSSSAKSVEMENAVPTTSSMPRSAVHKWSNTPPQAYSSFPISDLALLATPANHSFPSPSLYSVADTAASPPLPRLPIEAWNSLTIQYETDPQPLQRSSSSPRNMSRRTSTSSNSPTPASPSIMSSARLVSPATVAPNVRAEFVPAPSPSAESRATRDQTEGEVPVPAAGPRPEARHSLRSTRSASMHVPQETRSSMFGNAKCGSLPSESLTEPRPYVRARPVSVFNPLYQPSVPFQPEKKLVPIDHDTSASRERSRERRMSSLSRPNSASLGTSERRHSCVDGENEYTTAHNSPTLGDSGGSLITFTSSFAAAPVAQPTESAPADNIGPRTLTGPSSAKVTSQPIFSSPIIIPATPIPAFTSSIPSAPQDSDGVDDDEALLVAPIARRTSNLSVDIAATRRHSSSTTPPPRPIPSPLRRSSLSASPDTPTVRRKSIGPPVNPPSPMRRSHSPAAAVVVDA